MLEADKHNELEGSQSNSPTVWNQIVQKITYIKQKVMDVRHNLKTKWKCYHELKERSGWKWNEILCMLDVEPELWDEEDVDYKQCRLSGFIHFNKMEIICAKDSAKGAMAFGTVCREQSIHSDMEDGSQNTKVINIEDDTIKEVEDDVSLRGSGSKTSIGALCNMLVSRGLLKDSRHVPVIEQIGIFVRIVAFAAGDRECAEMFQHSFQTINKYFNVTLQAIVAIAPEMIKLPDEFVPCSNKKTNACNLQQIPFNHEELGWFAQLLEFILKTENSQIKCRQQGGAAKDRSVVYFCTEVVVGGGRGSGGN
ncbi:hypothetical protein AXF42_Ash006307 [Apostasia shenzhenica]|uniref:DUF8040 domain-containing protein n=1 Tax=Apostasia shenzhenica TaxID=1088818 RepID=A0A2I0AYP7_9ASPA|nr:hypothetical protein AXF42_Ash006307 [Apostasia shenzhenica]